MTAEKELIKVRDIYYKRSEECRGELTRQYWRGRADGIEEVLEMLEDNTNE